MESMKRMMSNPQSMGGMGEMEGMLDMMVE
jgi:hypothetical protein